MFCLTRASEAQQEPDAVMDPANFFYNEYKKNWQKTNILFLLLLLLLLLFLLHVPRPEAGGHGGEEGNVEKLSLSLSPVACIFPVNVVVPPGEVIRPPQTLIKGPMLTSPEDSPDKIWAPLRVMRSDKMALELAVASTAKGRVALHVNVFTFPAM